jgi:hypothetical protein
MLFSNDYDKKNIPYKEHNLSSITNGLNYLGHAKLVFVVTITIIHILYFIAFFGIFTVNETYVHYLNIFIQVFVILFLVIRFHPYKNVQSITPEDKTFVFASAVLLGTNLLTVEFASLIPHDYIQSTLTDMGLRK